MVASQRFPTYFDGIVAGAPGFDLPRAAVAEAWNETGPCSSCNKPEHEWPALSGRHLLRRGLILAANAILAACDGLDGLVDGIVDNYAACTSRKVYPHLDAIQCVGTKTPRLPLCGSDRSAEIDLTPVPRTHGERNFIPIGSGIPVFLDLHHYACGVLDFSLAHRSIPL